MQNSTARLTNSWMSGQRIVLLTGEAESNQPDPRTEEMSHVGPEY